MSTSKRHSRRSFVYFKDGMWRVQVGKWNNTFWTREWAVRALLHYTHSNDRNWQLARFLKGGHRIPLRQVNPAHAGHPAVGVF